MAQIVGQEGQQPLLVFYSYDPKDDKLREELEAHLKYNCWQGIK